MSAVPNLTDEQLMAIARERGLLSTQSEVPAAPQGPPTFRQQIEALPATLKEAIRSAPSIRLLATQGKTALVDITISELMSREK